MTTSETTIELPRVGEHRPPPPSEPPAPPDEPRRRRRWGRVAVIAMLFALLVGVLWVLISAWLFTGAIERIPAADLPSLDPVGAGPVNYLLVGSDSREDLPEDFGDFFGEFAGKRTDVIMLLHVLGDEGRVQMLSIPRDLKVEIPGSGTNRVNAAFALGGPDLLVRTVRQTTGLPIHHYLEIGFGGFAGVVDSLGGVDVSFPYAARDNKSGLLVEAGTEHLDGPMALAYVRSRKLEEFRDGEWVQVGGGDIARTARQQQVLSELIGQAKSPRNLFTMPFLARSVGSSLTVDAGVSIRTMAGLGWAMSRAGEIEAATLPVTNQTEDGRAYVVMTDAAADTLEAFAEGRPFG